MLESGDSSGKEMDGSSPGVNEKAGTVGGTLLVVVLQITSGEVLKTAVMAAVGAVVSFGVSWLLQHIVHRYRKSE